jgi:MFS family permease
MSSITGARTGAAESASAFESGYAKIWRRTIPILFLVYLASYLNRVNVGFAKMQMQGELGFNDAVYGLAAGLFFVGYLAFEIPSNAWMVRIGARKTFSRIIVLWSIASGAMAFVQGPTSFYVLRFALGAAEAGFSAGVVLYLHYMFPAQMRARAMSMITCSIAFSGALGAPVSGVILDRMHGVSGLSGWQWMFLIEALPSLLLGVIVWLALVDRPSEARWLTSAERGAITAELAREEAKHSSAGRNFADAFRNWRVYVLAFSYFTMYAAGSLISFWLPTFIAELGHYSTIQIGFLTALPYIAAGVFMVVLARSSDRRNERRWHCGLSALGGALALIASVYSGNALLSLLLLSIASGGIFASMPVFWAVPSQILTGAAAAAGIALISVAGGLGGLVGPAVAGALRVTTGSSTAPVLVLSGVLALGVLALLVLPMQSKPSAAAGAE